MRDTKSWAAKADVALETREMKPVLRMWSEPPPIEMVVLVGVVLNKQ